MKVFIAVTISIFLIIIGYFYMYNYIENHIYNFNNKLSLIYDDIERDNWSSAQSKFLKLNEEWNKIKMKWSIFIDHNQIENINLAMAKNKGYIKLKNKDFSLEAIDELKELFNIIKQREQLTLANIL